MVNSSTMTLIVIVMAFYFIGMIAISWMGRKYGKNFDDFISAGRNCTTLMIIGSAVGSHIGNGYVVGGAASGAAVGLSGAWYGIGCAQLFGSCTGFESPRLQVRLYFAS